MLDEKWYTVEQISKLLQVHEQTVRRWLREGDLVGRNFGGKTGYRVREGALRTFLDKEGKAAA